jgi:Rieske Fe-S protein
VTFLGFPRRVGADKPVIVQLNQLVTGQAQYERLRGKTIVVLSGADGPTVLDASCTHLGCTVIWDTSASVFRCPCHGAVFSSEGDVVSGPVSAPLKKVEFELSDGTLIVS